MILTPLHVCIGRSTHHPCDWGYVLWTTGWSVSVDGQTLKQGHWRASA